MSLNKRARGEFIGKIKRPQKNLRPLCPEQDSNLHTLASTSPSSWRVYQFHHLGIGTIKIVTTTWINVCSLKNLRHLSQMGAICSHSNLHTLASTSPSSWRVYQFHHLGIGTVKIVSTTLETYLFKEHSQIFPDGES